MRTSARRGPAAQVHVCLDICPQVTVGPCRSPHTDAIGNDPHFTPKPINPLRACPVDCITFSHFEARIRMTVVGRGDTLYRVEAGYHL